MEENTKPYKIREKAEKEANYRGLIRAELADELYDGILTIIVAQKNTAILVIPPNSWPRI